MPRRHRPIDDAVIQRLADAVLASRQTMVALAKALGCNRKTLYKWLDDTNRIPSDKLQQLCELIHLPPNQSAEQFTARDYSIPSVQPPALHQLRAPVSDFVGRDAEIERIVAALRASSQAGMVAAISGVRGMGGIGKTELALMAAQRVLPLFPGGQVVVELHGAGTAPLTAEHALQRILRALDPEAKLPEDLEALGNLYRSQLHGKRFLVLADDAQNMTQIQPLLPPPGCALLITSRQRFVLPGMVSIDLGVLSAAEAEQVLLAICPRIGSDAVQLAQLCASLPLALRIGASLLASNDSYSVAHYLSQLATERMKYLRDPQEPDNPKASVEAAIALSYAALDAASQISLNQLSVFVSDFDHATALAVLENDREDSLFQLRWRSLLEWEAPRQRYRLHDLVRAFASDRLQEPHSVQRRYAEYFVQRIDAAVLPADESPSRKWLETIEPELMHFRAALDWFAQHDLGERMLHLAVALGPFWLGRNTIREGSTWVETALQHAPIEQNDAAVRLRARALLLLGELQRMQGHVQIAKESFEHSAGLFLHVLEDEESYSDVLFFLGVLAADQNDYDAAQAAFEQCLQIAQQYDRQQRAGGALLNLGRIAMHRGNLAQAEAMYAEAAAILRAAGKPEQLGWLLLNLSALRSDRGDHETALDTIGESLKQFHALGHSNGLAWATYLKGTILANRATYAKARDVFDECIMRFEQLAIGIGTAMTHNKLTAVAMAQNDTRRAWQHAVLCLTYSQPIEYRMGISLGIERIGMLLVERDAILAAKLLGCAEIQMVGSRGLQAPIDQPLYEHALATLHAQLSDTDFATFWEQGRTLSQDDAAALALDESARMAAVNGGDG